VTPIVGQVDFPPEIELVVGVDLVNNFDEANNNDPLVAQDMQPRLHTSFENDNEPNYNMHQNFQIRLQSLREARPAGSMGLRLSEY
jgi:hypothetical protein